MSVAADDRSCLQIAVLPGDGIGPEVMDSSYSARLREWIERRELLVIETLGFLQESGGYEGMDFKSACVDAAERVRQSPVVFALDVNRARAAQYFPFPIPR